MMRKPCFLTLIVCLCSIFPAIANAQSDISTVGIPTDAVGAFVCSMTKIKAKPELELLPYEVMAYESFKELGIDPFTIRQATVAVRPGDKPTSPPQVGIALHFSEMPDFNNEFGRFENREDIAGYKAKNYRLFSRDLPMLLLDDKTVLILMRGTAPEPFLNAEPGKVSAMVDKVGKNPWDAFAVFAPKPFMAFYGETIKEQIKNVGFVPPPLQQLVPLLENDIESAEVVIEVEPYKFNAKLGFADAETAANASRKIREAAEFGAQMTVGVASAELDTKRPMQAALVDYFQRMIKEIPELPNFQNKGNDLVLSLEGEELIPPAISLMMGNLGTNLMSVRRNRAAAMKRREAMEAAGAFPPPPSQEMIDFPVEREEEDDPIELEMIELDFPVEHEEEEEDDLIGEDKELEAFETTPFIGGEGR